MHINTGRATIVDKPIHADEHQFFSSEWNAELYIVDGMSYLHFDIYNEFISKHKKQAIVTSQARKSS